MLKDSFNRGTWTKEKRNFLIAIVILTVIVFTVGTFVSRDDTQVFDDPKLTRSDSAEIDSIVEKLYSRPTAEDDSMYKAFKLDELDSVMSTPTSPLVDSLLKEL